MNPSVETRLRASFAAHEWIPVTHGMSDAATYQLRGREWLYVKLGNGLLAEALRIEWLNTVGIPGPRLCDAGESDGVQWLVMTAVPGQVVFDPWPADQRLRVIDAAAEILRALHSLPPHDCPFDRGLDVAIADARERRPDDTDLLAELEKTRPTVQDLVVCHGDYCTPNVLVDPDTLRPTGLVDLGRLGCADRCSDLALMRGSLRNGRNPQYGEAHVERFLTMYGADAEDARLDYYLRLDWG